MAYTAPGKHFRKGLSVKGFFGLFPDDETAEQWFIGRRWPKGIACPYCRSDNVNTKSKHKSMPFRCRKNKTGGCGKDFSVKTNTFMDSSNIGCQNWLFAPLPSLDKLEIRLVDEAAPRLGDHSEVRMALGTPNKKIVGFGFRRAVRRTG